MLPNSGEPSPTRKAISIIAWSLTIALLFSVVGLVFPSGDQDLGSRTVRLATTGLIFGSVFGAIQSRVIKGCSAGRRWA